MSSFEPFASVRISTSAPLEALDALLATAAFEPPTTFKPTATLGSSAAFHASAAFL